MALDSRGAVQETPGKTAKSEQLAGPVKNWVPIRTSEFSDLVEEKKVRKKPTQPMNWELCGKIYEIFYSIGFDLKLISSERNEIGTRFFKTLEFSNFEDCFPVELTRLLRRREKCSWTKQTWVWNLIQKGHS